MMITQKMIFQTMQFGESYIRKKAEYLEFTYIHVHRT